MTAPDQLQEMPEPDPQPVDPNWLDDLHRIKSREPEPPANELLAAPKSPAPSDLPGSPTAGSNDLRQRLADAITRAAHICWPECECDGAPIFATLSEGDPRCPTVHAVEASTEALAEVCAAEVQAMLDEKAAEVDDKSDVGHAIADAWQEEARQAHENRDYWRKRAEAAEERLDDIREEGRDL